MSDKRFCVLCKSELIYDPPVCMLCLKKRADSWDILKAYRLAQDEHDSARLLRERSNIDLERSSKKTKRVQRKSTKISIRKEWRVTEEIRRFVETHGSSRKEYL